MHKTRGRVIPHKTQFNERCFSIVGKIKWKERKTLLKLSPDNASNHAYKHAFNL